MYSEACQKSQMEFLAKIVNSWKPVFIFAKSSVLDVWQSSAYTWLSHPTCNIDLHSFILCVTVKIWRPSTDRSWNILPDDKDFNDSFSQHIVLSTQYASLFDLTSVILYFVFDIWDKVFKSGLSKFCGRQPLKNFKGYGLLKEKISLEFF